MRLRCQAIVLCIMLNADVLKGRGISQMRTPADRGGSRKTGHFAGAHYGRPLWKIYVARWNTVEESEQVKISLRKLNTYSESPSRLCK